jgi:hypothetical protein
VPDRTAKGEPLALAPLERARRRSCSPPWTAPVEVEPVVSVHVGQFLLRDAARLPGHADRVADVTRPAHLDRPARHLALYPAYTFGALTGRNRVAVRELLRAHPGAPRPGPEGRLGYFPLGDVTPLSEGGTAGSVEPRSVRHDDLDLDLKHRRPR